MASKGPRISAKRSIWDPRGAWIGLAKTQILSPTLRVTWHANPRLPCFGMVSVCWMSWIWKHLETPILNIDFAVQQDDATPVVFLAFHGRCLRDSILAGHLHRVVQAVVYRWIVWFAFHIYKVRQQYHGQKIDQTSYIFIHFLRVLKLRLPEKRRSSSLINAASPAFETYDTMLFFCPEATALQGDQVHNCLRKDWTHSTFLWTFLWGFKESLQTFKQ